jgi:predicted TIM-barrel fold metal-dependent hydrolase
VYADRLVRPWLAEVEARVPGLELFDAHTHLGHNDPDEFKCSREELLAGLDAARARAVVFPMREPDGYPPANDMILAAAEASEGRLVPFCRLDPHADPLPELERCLSAGARGVKLHPRAESFSLDTPELRGVFELADERRLPVLVHAGRGIPALGRHAVEICERHPGVRLILAHAAISDLAWIWRAARDLPNLFIDSAWWSASDLLAMWSLVPPGNLLFASDAPYGSVALAAISNLRYALQAGLGEDAIRLAFGGQLARLVAGEEPADAGPAPGPGAISPDPLLDRVHTFLVSAIGQGIVGVDPVEALSLAALACEVGEDAPQAEVCATVLRLIELRQRLIELGEDDGRPARFAPGLPMIVMAACVARTPDVPMPPVGGAAVGVGERVA